MPEADEIDPAFLTGGLSTFASLWPIVGNDLPAEVEARLRAELERLGDPKTWSDVTKTHSERLQLSRTGLLAAYYHRDHIEAIEREVIRRIRAADPPTLPPGASASVRMPVVGHEFVAYLLAARRTLDYLARGVGACFGRPRVYRITKLATSLNDAHPQPLAIEAAELSVDVTARFPHLLGQEGRLSDRDRAAHYWPIEPTHLLIVHFHAGGLGLEFRDAGHGYLPTYDDLYPSRMSRDELLLTTAIDKQLADLSDFVVALIARAVDASLAASRAVTRRVR